tara:strand:- start:171 stop:926 length:756 start_codon:yes stop_codon:yes gene_type:complete
MLAYLAIFLGCIIFVFLTEKYRNMALFFTIIAAIIFPFSHDSSRWNWFYFVKVYSVIIPIIILSIIQSRFYNNFRTMNNLHTFVPNIVKLIFIINVLLGSLLLINLDQYIIGCAGLVLIITMPKFSFNDSQNVGFNNVEWIMGYVFCFIIGVILYPISTNFVYPVFVALIIPIIFCYFIGDWSKWFSFRVYSIYFILILDVFFTKDDFLIYESVNGFSALQSNNIIITVILQTFVFLMSFYLVKKRWFLRI